MGSDSCDTEVLLERLSDSSDAEVIEVMASIRGPFAFVYLREAENSKKLFFGRDYFGRHCLLIGAYL